jgi:pilus assembly protein Flp/PilA
MMVDHHLPPHHGIPFDRVNRGPLQAFNGGWGMVESQEQRTRSNPMQRLTKLVRDDRGATAIEYGLIAALIAVAAIGAMAGLGNQLSTTFNNVSTNMKVS